MIGFVYMLYCEETQKVYVGSTVKDPGQRYNEHAYNPEHSSARELFYVSKDIRLKILEVVEFQDISELRKREMIHINSNKNCVNIIKSYTPGRTEEKKRLKEHNERLLESIETCEIRIPVRCGWGGGRKEAQNATD